MVLAGEIGAVKHVEASLSAELAGRQGLGRLDAPRASGCGGCRRKHGSNGALGDIGIHIVDFASYRRGLDVAHVFARLKTFDKAPDNRIGEYDSRRQRQPSP